VLIVVMGVTGVGKTTVGRLIATELSLPFHDADDFHPETNRRKMAAGIPLSEGNREPWLRELARHIPEWERSGGAVIACSALRAAHRQILQAASGHTAIIIFLDATPETIRERLMHRVGHYMPPTLLDSQLTTLETPTASEALRIAADRPPGELARQIVHALKAHPASG
jgi:carbohydrate kinase (thermoresistant glucokinase family)